MLRRLFRGEVWSTGRRTVALSASAWSAAPASASSAGNNEAWFRPAGGLQFECSQCGKCCTGGTKVSPGEIEELLEHLNKGNGGVVANEKEDGSHGAVAKATTHDTLLNKQVNQTAHQLPSHAVLVLVIPLAHLWRGAKECVPTICS